MLTLQVFLADVVIGQLGGEVLRRNALRRQKVGQPTGPGHAEPILHGLGGITTEKRGVAPGAHAVFDQFLLARLDGGVALREGDVHHARITVRRDEVADLPGQDPIVDGPL